MYSNPPVHGARIVAEVVNDEAMFGEWKEARSIFLFLIECAASASLCVLHPCQQSFAAQGDLRCRASVVGALRLISVSSVRQRSIRSLAARVYTFLG
jgi:hypothetical protein